MSVFSTKLPKIVLDRKATHPHGQRDPTNIAYTISFNYKHFAEGGSLAYDWTPEYSADFIAADDEASRIRRFRGYRFNIQLSVTDAFLMSGGQSDPDPYELEYFEDYLNYLSIWGQAPTQIIYVYPWNNKTYNYQCVLDSFVKTNHIFSGDSFKTKAHDYTIALSAKWLVQTKPTTAY